MCVQSSINLINYSFQTNYNLLLFLFSLLSPTDYTRQSAQLRTIYTVHAVNTKPQFPEKEMGLESAAVAQISNLAQTTHLHFIVNQRLPFHSELHSIPTADGKLANCRMHSYCGISVKDTTKEPLIHVKKKKKDNKPMNCRKHRFILYQQLYNVNNETFSNVHGSLSLCYFHENLGHFQTNVAEIIKLLCRGLSNDYPGHFQMDVHLFRLSVLPVSRRVVPLFF